MRLKLIGKMLQTIMRINRLTFSHGKLRSQNSDDFNVFFWPLPHQYRINLIMKYLFRH